MTPEQIELARRLVASERWRWFRGLPLAGRGLSFWVTDGGFVVALDECCDHVVFGPGHERALPDLNSTLVVGWLMHLVREAWGAPHAVAVFYGEAWDAAGRFLVRPDMWRVIRCGTDDGTGPTEVEALIAALLAAPEAP